MWKSKTEQILTRRRSARSAPTARSKTRYATQNSYTKDMGLEKGVGSWFDLQKQCMQNANYICQALAHHPNGYGIIRCKNPAIEAHHIVPLSRGGANTLANLMALCKTCHDARHKHLFRSRNRMR